VGVRVCASARAAMPESTVRPPGRDARAGLAGFAGTFDPMTWGVHKESSECCRLRGFKTTRKTHQTRTALFGIDVMLHLVVAVDDPPHHPVPRLFLLAFEAEVPPDTPALFGNPLADRACD
jgi:hypothetical protein